MRSILKQSADKLEKRALYTASRVIRELGEIADTTMLDFFEKDANGRPRLRNIMDLPKSKARAVKRFTWHPEGTVTVELYDGLRARQTIGRFLGLHRTVHELGEGASSMVELLKLAAGAAQEDRAQRAIPVTVDVDAKVVDVPDGHVLGYENGNSGNNESLDKNRANMEPGSPDHPGRKDPPGGPKP